MELNKTYVRLFVCTSLAGLFLLSFFQKFIFRDFTSALLDLKHGLTYPSLSLFFNDLIQLAYRT